MRTDSHPFVRIFYFSGHIPRAQKNTIYEPKNTLHSTYFKPLSKTIYYCLKKQESFVYSGVTSNYIKNER